MCYCRKGCFLFGLLLFLAASLFSQQITEMQFNNQPIRDILLVLAEISGQSILADETVNGNASYFFTNTDLDTALSQFLPQYGIYYTESDGIYRVSKILTSREGDTIGCKAEDVDLQLIIRRLTRDLDVTILHDALPRDRVTINFHGGQLEELLRILIKPYPRFFLEKGDHYYYLRQEKVSTSQERFGSGGTLFVREGEMYSADFQEISFKNALIDLMKAEGREFVFLGTSNNIIDFFRHDERSFEEMLNLVLKRGNATYQLSSGIYYILDLDRQDILRQYFTTIRIPLQNQSVDRLNSLIPSSLNYSRNMRTDTASNSVILTGTLQEIEPLEAFLRQLDAKQENTTYHRYDLQYITLEEFKKRLAPEMAGIPLVALGDRAFLVPLSEKKHEELEYYLTLVDSVHPVHAVKLAYLQWEQLSKNLPPTIKENQIHPSNDPTLVFFEGSSGELELLQAQLKEMDLPTPQIRYEVLVLQIEESQGLDLDSSLSVNSNSSESSGLLGELAGLASLSFDVVTQFGYQFAANLSVGLSQKQSHVLADTTIYGLSGELIRFQNTNTSRHSTTQVDADTGEKEVTGFREITSGLIVEVKGWVSGNRMITMEVESTISNQAGGATNDADAIPTTTEKIVNTHVRSPSGEPLILSGLKQRESITEVQKVPFWGHIPLLGLLFQKRVETLKNTEFVITLIPYVEKMEEVVENPYKALYTRYCQRNP